MRSLVKKQPENVIRKRLRISLGSDFLFLTLRGESHRPPSQGFVLAHTTGQARYQRTHRCNVSTQTLRNIFKLIAQPPDQ